MSFSIGGMNFSRPPENDSEVLTLATSLANELAKKLPTEQDVYWFVIEQYDEMQGYNSGVNQITSNFPISLYEIEYSGRKSEDSYVGKPNPGMIYLNTSVTPVLQKLFGNDTAELVRTAIFGTLCDGLKDIISNLRLKYAVHYHNNCVSSSSWRYADEWNEVITSLGGE